MSKHEDNRAFLDRLMTFSKCGPVMQLFIMNALEKVSETVAAQPIEKLRKDFGENALVHPDAWHAAACELQAELQKHLS